ncbi:hypothetical protein [Paenibacillus sp. GCM10027626]|uniref:hypothetical protein n=1 Tax=Paenibacillus sp. GCM10027626 TaxID=3273411 RepID=UPI00363EC428
MRKQVKWRRIASALLLMGVLAGCGASVSEGMQNERAGRSADVMGKVVSITADAITLQKSKMEPSDMPGGGQNFGRGRQQGDGELPRQGTDGGNADQGERLQWQGDRAGQRDRAGGGRQGQMEWSDEQVTMKIAADTEISVMSFGNGQRSNEQVELSDIQDGDILTVWLAEDGETAQSIMKRQMPSNIGRAGEGQ